LANVKPAHAAPAASAVAKPAEPSQKKQCFVISPIGPAESETRKKADQVLKHIIKKALADTYAVERADDISVPGLITLQIIESLMKAPMVVADLTDANANVYYELAIRHFVKKPVVHLITEGQDPLFDVAQMRYIRYDLTNPDSVEQAGKDLRDHAAACEKGEVTFTPIQFVEMLDTARSEGENEFVAYALGIQAALSNLQSDVRQIGDYVRYLTTAFVPGAAVSLNQQGLFAPPGRGGFASLGAPYVVSGVQGWLTPTGTGVTIRAPAPPQAPAPTPQPKTGETEPAPATKKDEK
jgi:hypothetical protein